MLVVSIQVLLKWAFIINIAALFLGFILSKMGYTKAGKILSYISMVAVSVAIVYMVLIYVLYYR